MPNGRLLAMVLAVVATGLPITGAVAGEVNVGINIGVPAPPRIVLPAPPPVVAVPATYYKIPPGNAKKMERRAAVPAGPASAGWCPPGQAKKGRC